VSPGRWFAAIVLVLYLLFLAACATLTFLDPVWRARSGYDGTLGLLASFAAGLPWSFLVFFGAGSSGASDATAAALMWACALVNLSLLAIPLGFWRTIRRTSAAWQRELLGAGRAPGCSTPARQSLARLAREAVRQDFRERIIDIATRFDARRKVPHVRLLCVLAAVMVLLWMVRANFGPAQEGAPPDSTRSSVVLSLLLLLAVAGTCCRHFCGNARLQHSRPLYLLATAGTAAGTILGLAQTMLLAGMVPLLALVVALFAGWQAWLLAATVGTRAARPAD
jgi:hypothetical protein